MPVKVRCSSCDKVLTVPDAARGKAVKCPQCDARVAVPAGDSDDSSITKPKKKPAAAAATTKTKKPADSEDFLASLDLRKAEDTNARICPKCGYDMYEMDEEETECPKCGFDVEAGGMGAKAKKRALKGPDPADFYPGLAKNAIKFLGKNQGLVWRTNAYTAVCLLISLLCAFLYLWISPWPPRAFFALCFFVSFLVIPGWLWFLDCEVIKLTLERKDKFKKLNFDFFLCSSKGVLSAGWAVVAAGPIIALPALLGYYLVYYNNQPEWVMAVCIGVGLLPVVWMLPITMSHMTMPIPFPGWMFWKVLQYWGRTLGGASVWLMWFILTNIPNFAAVGVIAGVWGNDIQYIVKTMESNADASRKIAAAENAPKGKNAQPVDVASLPKPVEVDLKPLIGPVIILLVMCLPFGYIAMFNMRTNGQFTYYFKERMELIDKAKEYKYVAKERRKSDDDDDDGPRTMQKDLTEAIAVPAVCILIGVIGGMLYGTLTDAGVPKGILFGSGIGVVIAALPSIIGLLIVAFGSKEMLRKMLIQNAVVLVALIGVLIAFFSMGGWSLFGTPQAPAPAAAPSSV